MSSWHGVLAAISSGRLERWATLAAVSFLITLAFLVLPGFASAGLVVFVYILFLVVGSMKSTVWDSLILGILCSFECAFLLLPFGVFNLKDTTDWFILGLLPSLAVLTSYLRQHVRPTPLHPNWESHFLREMSVLREAEQSLRDSRARLDTAIHNAKIGFFDWDLEKETGHWSPSMVTMFGYQPVSGSVSGEEWRRLIHHEDRDWLAGEIKRAVRADKKIWVEFRIVRPDGETRLISGRARLVQNDHGRLVRLVGTCADVTEQRRAEVKLWQQRGFLKNFVAQSATRIALFDRKMRCLQISDSSLKAFSLKREEIIGRCLYEAVPWIPESWRAAHARCLAGSVECFEEEYVGPDGTRQSARWEMRPWGDDGNETGGIMIFAEDLTEHKRVEKEKDAALALLETIIRNAPLSFAFFDTQLRYQLVTKHLAEMNGIPVEQHIGRTVDEIVPAAAEHFRAIYEEILKTQRPVLGQKIRAELSSQPGVERSFSMNWYPVHNHENTLLGMGAIVEETTGLKHADTAPSSGQAELSGGMEFSNQAVITVDESQRILALNTAAARMFGYTMTDVLAKPLQHLIPKAASLTDSGRVLADGHILQFQGSGLSSPLLLTGLLANGEEIPLEAVISNSETDGSKCFTLVLRAIEKWRAA